MKKMSEVDKHWLIIRLLESSMLWSGYWLTYRDVIIRCMILHLTGMEILINQISKTYQKLDLSVMVNFTILPFYCILYPLEEKAGEFDLNIRRWKVLKSRFTIYKNLQSVSEMLHHVIMTADINCHLVFNHLRSDVIVHCLCRPFTTVRSRRINRVMSDHYYPICCWFLWLNDN